MLTIIHQIIRSFFPWRRYHKKACKGSLQVRVHRQWTELNMIEEVFSGCVLLLIWAAKKLGMTYEAINVWIFCIIWPLFTLALMVIVIWQWWLLYR
jgi:hypothetical protein